MTEKSAIKSNDLNIRDLVNLKQILIDEKLVTEEKLKSAEIRAQSENIPLSKVLTKSGYVTEEQLVRFTGELIHVPYVNMKNYTIDRDVLDLISEKMTKAIVDRFEAIQVNIEQGQWTAISFGASEFPFELFDQISAVGQSGQWIRMGEQRKLLCVRAQPLNRPLNMPRQTDEQHCQRLLNYDLDG